jgi:hypothetical protein
MTKRRPTNEELRLLEALAARSKNPLQLCDFLRSILVEEMEDGGMGSLRLHVAAATAVSRRFKSQAAELQFVDQDGAVVIESLYISEDGYPFELDLWKPTFEPLIQIPNKFDDVDYGSD